MPDDGTFDCNDQHWLRHKRFVYAGRELSYAELRADTEAEAAGLDRPVNPTRLTLDPRYAKGIARR